jgi:hypothetical protein
MVGETIGGGCVAAAQDGLASNTAGDGSCGSAPYILACIALSGGTASNAGCTTPAGEGLQCLALTPAGGEAVVRQFFVDNLGCDSPETCDPVVRAIFMEQFGCDSPESCQAEHFGGGGDGGDDGGDGGDPGGGTGTGGGTTSGGTTTNNRTSETDTTRPETTLRRKKPRLIRAATDRRKAIYKFRFRSSERDSTFECKLDRRDWRRCSSPKRVKVAPGRHKFRVRATDEAGNTDRTPAISRWRVPKPD